MPDETWPPEFTLDQERILNLLTGDRFYSNPSAALREAILNAIDAVHRRRSVDQDFSPEISVIFDRDAQTLVVADNGVGMSRADVADLFTKIGASAATAEVEKKSVGEFGIGVISYFMAGDSFTLQTRGAEGDAIGLAFSREMLAGGGADELHPSLESQGTTVTIQAKDNATFTLLLDSFPHWCRDVDGLSGQVLPEGKALTQGGAHGSASAVVVEQPEWVERAHLGPVKDLSGWEAMTGTSTVSVLYRGVFVQEFSAKGVWGIEGSIDVDPKHFLPRLNREGFVEGEFQAEVESFLRASHPTILEALARILATAVESGSMGKWTVNRWANLWLSVPRQEEYEHATMAWDAVFRALPAFERAIGNKWEPISLDDLISLGADVFVAPLAQEKTNDVVQAALRFLRSTGEPVIRGIRQDSTWMQFAGRSYGTTAELITAVFENELPRLKSIVGLAEQILTNIERIAPLYTGPPAVDLVRLGADSSPVLRLQDRLVINTDHSAGAEIVKEALSTNAGSLSLIGITARHAYDQLTQVAKVVRDGSGPPEILGPIRRRFIQSLLS